MAGRKPIPTTILKLRGTYRKDRHGNSIELDPAIPICPYFLSNRAKITWRQVVKRLTTAGILTELDGNALARYCDAFVRWREAADWLEKKGTVYTTKYETGKTKGIRQFPQVAQYHQFGQTLLRLEQEFGMTPSSRSRISAPTDNGQNEKNTERFFAKTS